jgi:sialate O-acetylesterase
MRIRSRLASLATWFTCGLPLWAQTIELPAILSPGVVLPAGKRAPIWGSVAGLGASAAEGGRIELVLLDGERRLGAAQGELGLAGQFELELELPGAGGPFALLVRWSAPGSAEPTVERRIEPVWLGQVWLAGGQSNMEWPLWAVGDATEGGAMPAGEPRLALFQVPNRVALAADPRGGGVWTAAEGQALRDFSAVAFFFGRRLERELDQPIGLVDATWGGTRIEAWLSEAALAKQPGLAFELASLQALRAEAQGGAAEAELSPDLAAGLHLGMLAPLERFPFDGAIWYQGESNCAGYGRYAALMGALIDDWRGLFRRPELPVFAVEIAPFGYSPEFGEPARLREAQRQALTGPGLGLAPTIDLGDPADIHPKDKRTVGERLARLALSQAYGRSALTSGEPLAAAAPRPVAFEFHGSEALVRFGEPFGLLRAKGGLPEGLALAGADRRFHPASARFDGADLRLSSAQVPAPIAVRYAFEAIGTGNLLADSGWPVSPFRSDDWPIEPAPLDADEFGPAAEQRFVPLARADWQAVGGSALGAQPTWRFEGDRILCSGRPTSLLLSRRRYLDFVLEFDWRHLQPGGNSGLFLWSEALPAPGSPFTRGIEVQIMDGEPGSWYTTQGDVFPVHDARLEPENGRGGMRAFPTEARTQPAPAWNHYRVVARGGAVELWVNGALVTRARGAEPCDGFLALESEGSPIEFRRLRLLELEPAGAAAAGAPVEASAAAPEREFPYRRLIALYDGLGLGRWRTLGAQGSFEARDALLSAAGPGELEFEGPIVDWVQRAGAGAERGGAPARGRAARNPRRAARSAAPSECLELSLDFRRLEPSLDLPLRLVGVAWPEAAAALAPVGSWNRLVLRLERPPRPADPAPRGDSAEPANSSDSADGAEAADSANSADLADPAHSAAAARLVVTLNGQRLPDPPPSAACLSADGRLTLAGLALVPGGVPTEFMNLLLGEPLSPAQPAALEAIETLRAPR